MSKTSNEQLTRRNSFNRFLGLGAYAGAIIMVGLLCYGIFDQLSLGRPLTKDASPLAIIGCAALICLAIGYSSRRKECPEESTP